MESQLPDDLRHQRIATNGVNLHVVTAGPPDGAPVVLLHGFPEFWYGWRHQIGPLAAAGYHVVVPDQRGYNLSDKPRGLAAYTRQELSRDVLGLLDHFGADRASLVAHDWGGAVAWWTALQHPERVERLVALNIPHPAAMARALRGLDQLRKSWYIGFFQLPWVPELWLARKGYAPLLSVIKRSCRPGAVTSAELARYREALARPGALPAMLAWYRAVVQRPSERLRSSVVEPPTLLVWGRRDGALGWQMAQPSVELCRHGRLVMLDDAGHFTALDAPDRVTELILDWMGSSPPPSARA